ncbi:MAG: DUF7545 family protein [Halobacteriota archaeon]
MVETETYTVESPAGDTDTVELPAGLVEALSEEDEPPSTVVADVTLLSFVQRAHALVHHSHGDPSEDLEAINESAEELFEERFGVSFAEATGHSH